MPKALKEADLPLSVAAGGRWSGGGKATIVSLAFAADRHPDVLSFGSKGAALIPRNIASSRDLIRGRYVLMPGNALPWADWPRRPQDFALVGALRVGSELAMRRATAVVRIGRAIPPVGNATEILPLTLDPAFEDAARFALETDSRFPSSRYLVSVGSITAYRNHVTLIDAYRAYRQEGGRLPLVIAGGGLRYDRERLAALCCNIEDIHLLSDMQARTEIVALLSHARACIFQSLVEASPMTVLEALAVNGRVLCSDIPGHRDIAAGFLSSDRFFPPKDSDVLKKLLLRCENDEQALPPSSLATRDARQAQRVQWADRLASMVVNLLKSN